MQREDDALSPHKEYGPSFVCVAIEFLQRFLLFSVISLVNNRLISPRWSATTALGFALIMSVVLTIRFWKGTRLLVGTGGFEYRENGRVIGSWIDVAAIGPNPLVRIRKTADGVILRHSDWQYMGLLAVLPMRSLPIGFIPVARLDRNWRNGPIGRDLRQYAPWLFTDEASQTASAALSAVH